MAYVESFVEVEEEAGNERRGMRNFMIALPGHTLWGCAMVEAVDPLIMNESWIPHQCRT